MHILLIYGEGRVEEALLLSATGLSMRVLRRGQADTLEFRNRDGVWTNESGGVVQIGAALPLLTAPPEAPELGEASTAKAGLSLDRFRHVLTN